jgi:low temperature requirement protein LtrA
MANMLYFAHSGLRFLVLLSAVIAIAVLFWGWNSRRAYEGQSRAAATVFTRVLGLQFLLGIGTVLTRPWYGALIGHLIMMFAAIGVAEGVTGYARKQPDARRAHMIALIGVVLALVLILGGIMAIGRTPFQMTATATSPG